MNAATISDEHRLSLFQALELLNTFLKGNTYLTGSQQPTLADAVIFVSISNVVVSSITFKIELVGDMIAIVNKSFHSSFHCRNLVET